MGVVAPVSGVLAAAVPVLVGMAGAGLPGPLRLAGFALGMVAVVLVSAGGGGAAGRAGLGLAIVAGLSLGGYNVSIARVDPGSTFLSLAVSRAVAAAVMAGLLVAMRPGRPSVGIGRFRLAGLVVVVGFLDMTGNASYVIAAQLGRLDVAAVLSSLYPVATIVLAAAVLHERVTRIHLAGMGAALAAIALIAGG